MANQKMNDLCKALFIDESNRFRYELFVYAFICLGFSLFCFILRRLFFRSKL